MDDLTGLMAVMMLFGTPILLAAVIAIGWWAGVRAKCLERDRSRKLYQSLMLEKLDIIKTAVAMGYDGAELKALDKRLEQLVGTDQLRGLLEQTPAVPLAMPQQLASTDIGQEAEQLRKAAAEENAK